MTSPKKIAANQRNARKSTGPRTASGKKSASANALRHGLAAFTLQSSANAAQVERLAKAICPSGAPPSQYQLALTIAESDITLRRVRAARVAIIERAFTEAQDEREHAGVDQRRADLEGNARIPPPSSRPLPITTLGEAEALRRALPQLIKLDRYAQRALARGNRAARRFVANLILGAGQEDDLDRGGTKRITTDD